RSFWRSVRTMRAHTSNGAALPTRPFAARASFARHSFAAERERDGRDWKSCSVREAAGSNAESYQKSLSILTALTSADEQRMEWQQKLAKNYAGLAKAQRALGLQAEAAETTRSGAECW